MLKQVLYEIFDGHQVTHGLLDEATKLFREHYRIWGEHSHNPGKAASIMAAASTFGSTIYGIDLDFISVNAEGSIRASSIPYVRDAKLRGLLFEGFAHRRHWFVGRIPSSFVHHKEPEDILNMVSGVKKWSLGKLPEDHEHLLILNGRPVISSS